MYNMLPKVILDRKQQDLIMNLFIVDMLNKCLQV